MAKQWHHKDRKAHDEQVIFRAFSAGNNLLRHLSGLSGLGGKKGTTIVCFFYRRLPGFAGRVSE